MLLGFYAGAANPRVRDVLGHYGESFTEVYQTLLDAYGLRRRAPYMVEHLATTIAALLDGFHPLAEGRPATSRRTPVLPETWRGTGTGASPSWLRVLA